MLIGCKRQEVDSPLHVDDFESPEATADIWCVCVCVCVCVDTGLVIALNWSQTSFVLCEYLIISSFANNRKRRKKLQLSSSVEI